MYLIKIEIPFRRVSENLGGIGQPPLTGQQGKTLLSSANVSFLPLLVKLKLRVRLLHVLTVRLFKVLRQDNIAVLPDGLQPGLLADC